MGSPRFGLQGHCGWFKKKKKSGKGEFLERKIWQRIPEEEGRGGRECLVLAWT